MFSKYKIQYNKNLSKSKIYAYIQTTHICSQFLGLKQSWILLKCFDNVLCISCLSARHGGNYPNPEIGASISIDELKHYEKEIRRELDGVQKEIENEDVGSSEQQG